ncbi:M23 family metallopeptidase [uncultured Microscilla sp.]|uniref:M23 family metallopeptidase n=1 Tax=uncultured Microscilla sp. TaxID=432653 RepID=UPI00261C18E2|nr:M23 family metallopeptidase [uncultured Microscilla sp.]
MKLTHPLKNEGVITSTYKWRGNHFHPGIDIAAGMGTQIVAVASGIVVQAKQGCNVGQAYCNKGLGNYCVIDHKNGYYTAYAHLTDLHTKEGQKVRGGDVIGTEGSTGYSTGSHLHFELRTDLNLVQKPGSLDPYPYLYEGKELPISKNNYLFEIVATILVVGLIAVIYKRGVFTKIKSKIIGQ